MNRLVLLMTLYTAVLTLSAQTISREEARLQAEQFLQQRGHSATLRFTPQLSRGKTSHQLEEVPDYYVFNTDTEQGFVVMAADSRMPQSVLAYSLHGSFDPDHLNGPVKDWLVTIEKQMEWLRDNNSQAPSYRAPARKAVTQLLTTKWHQTNPYNSHIAGGKYLTGCGATAMAQVMNYHKFPTAVQASIPAYNTLSLKVHMNGVAAGTAIDWANMVNDYHEGSTSAAQKNAVADLMLYCGTSVEMDYGTDFSGSALEDIASALKKYFGYYKGIRIRYHEEMSNQAWDDLIYSELDAGRPVMISGMSASNGGDGHIFVCDGYDGSGHYHINWGWGGYQDGYFVLTNLTPPDEPPGYNFWQGCITGVKPDDGTFTEQVVLTTVDFGLYDINTWEPTTQTEYTRPAGYAQYPVAYGFSYRNMLANTYRFDVNVGVFQDGKLVEVLFGENGFKSNDELSNAITSSFGAAYLPREASNTTFKSPGTYILKVVSRQSGTTEWLENEGSDEYCLVCVIDAQMKMICGIGLGTVTPGPGPDEPEKISETERSNLAYSIGQLVSAIDLKVSNLNAEKAKLEELYGKAQQTVADYGTIRNKYALIRQQVQESQLSDANKQDFYNYIDQELAILGGESVEAAAKKAQELAEAALSNLENELAALEQMLSMANVQDGQVAAETDLTAFNKLKADYQSLYNTFAARQAFSTSKDLSNATNYLTAALNNLSVFNDRVAYLNQQAEKAIESAGLQERRTEVYEKVQNLRNTLVQLTTELNNSRNAYSDIAEKYNQIAGALSGLADKLNDANRMLGNASMSDSQRESLTQKLLSIRDELKEYQTSLSNVYKKIGELESLMLPVDQQNNLVSTFNTLFADFQNATTEEALADVESRVASLLGTLEQDASQNAAYKESLDNTNNDVEALKSPMNELETSISELVEAIKTAHDEYVDEQEQLQAMKKKVDEALDLLKQKIETAKDEFGKKNNEAKSIDDAFQEKKNALEELKKRLEKVEEQLSKAELTEERRDSLVAVCQGILSALDLAREAEEEVENQLAGIASVNSDDLNALADTYNELVNKFNGSSTKEEFEELEGKCEGLHQQINELYLALSAQRSSLSDMKVPIGALLTNADELADEILKLAKGIEAAEKLTAEELAQKEKEEQEKRELEEARQVSEGLLKEVTDDADAVLTSLKAVYEEAQVLAEEDEVKELLGQLNIVANRLNEIATGLSNQQQAIGSATTKEGLSKIDGLLGDYKNELAKMAEELNNLRTKLKTILTAVSPLAIDGKKIVGCYDTNGRPTDIRKKGLKILRLSDGTTRKVYIK